MSGWFAFAIYTAKDIGPLTEQEDFLPEDNTLTIVGRTLRNEFPGSSSNALKVWIFWGVKNISKDDVGSWDSSDLGKVEMDPNFSLSSKESQQNILDFCDDLKKQDFVLNEKVSCWLKDTFDAWLKTPTA